MADYEMQLESLLGNFTLGKWNSARISQELYSLLTTNSTGGKLYKYRSFDPQGYALSSLKNQILYCSRPSAFNDPFDCRARVDLISFDKAISSHFITDLIPLLQEFKSVLFKNKPIELCAPALVPKIKQLLDSPSFCAWAHQCANNDLSLSQNMNLLFQESPDICNFIFSLFSQQAMTVEQQQILHEALNHMLETIDPELLIKKDASPSIFTFLQEDLEVIDDVDETTKYINQLQKMFPGQAESAAALDEEFRKKGTEIYDKIDESFYIGCLSQAYNNALMWAHYSDCHKGFCIEYDFSTLDFEQNQLLFFPVIYSDTRPSIPWEAGFASSSKNPIKYLYPFMRLLLTKDSSWSYENEWRILLTAQPGNQKLYLPCISCLYLGAKCTDENKEKILSIAKGLNVPVKQLTLDRGMYDLHAKLL